MRSSWDPGVALSSCTTYPRPVMNRANDRNAEGDLIDDALQGRTEAFADLVQPHLSALTRLARLRLRSEAEAEDIVQQAVLRAFRHLPQFRREASFKTWLCAITFHEVSQLHRGKSTNMRPLYEARASRIPDPSSDPEAQCQQRQAAERLHQALTRLPEKYRSVIQLRDLRELSIAETARSLSVTAAVVKIRHHRARKLLVRSLRMQTGRIHGAKKGVANA
ncbi:MAG: sigma-70 family RNA polymerase sigma factor [Bryobacterales bacterium]|nr:sigma-70 family RNA polymerase sigma factor [Bryobacterales bacterium]